MNNGDCELMWFADDKVVTVSMCITSLASSVALFVAIFAIVAVVVIVVVCAVVHKLGFGAVLFAQHA